jgi:SAM-dependent methyltransferase
VRRCPVCDASSERATLFLKERLDTARLNEYSFASRKVPEFMNHKLVRCEECDLVYVESPPHQAELAQAYHVAAYDSASEASDAAATYVAALKPVLAGLPRKNSVLEIGTGTGVLLEKLADEGFETLVGVEPSSAAIAAASAKTRASIRQGIFEEDDFEPESFDLICCFMTMEHVADPGKIARSAYRLLRAGGAFVTVTHNYRGLVNRVLAARSPIIDIEHMQLFSRKSLRRLFEASGYRNVRLQALRNSYALEYWLRLAPLPAKLNRTVLALATRLGLSGRKLAVDVGNVLCAGTK